MSSVEIIADKMISGGNCIARIDGKAVFVPDALPGERLAVRIVQRKRDYDFAVIEKILEPSAHRIVPPCPLYGICGGCNLQTADAAYQTELRSLMLAEAFERNGFRKELENEFQLPEIVPITGDPWEYRSRVQFHTSAEGSTRTTGFQRRTPVSEKDEESERFGIVPIDDCPVAVPEIRAALKAGVFKQSARERFHVFAGSRICVCSDDAHLVWDGLEGSRTECTVRLLDKNIVCDVRGFFQSNLPLFERMIQTACGGMSGSLAADLYSGTGTFAVFLSDTFHTVALLEHNRKALLQAEKNLTGKKHTSYGVSAERWPAQAESKKNFDLVIADPPRSGLDRSVLNWFCVFRNSVARLHYVSCNPATLARDAAALVKSGYKCESLYFFDFYPQTSHIETLAVFR